MTPTEVFLWGAGGSIAVEVIAWAKLYGGSRVKIPARYTFTGFYFSQLVLAGVAGGLAVAYQIDKPLLAANIGAAAPLLIQVFTQGFSGRSEDV